MFLLTCYLIFSCLWGIYIIRYLRKIIYDDLNYLTNKELIIPEKFKPFVRTDRANWKICLIYFGATFLFPIRLIAAVIALTYLAIVATVLGLKNKSTAIVYQPQWKCTIYTLNVRIVSRFVQFCLGFMWIGKKNYHIKDFLKDYPHNEKVHEKEPSIIISNHTTSFDFLTFTTSKYCPSFIAKQSVANIPIINAIAYGLQSIFVNRESQEKRTETLNLIVERTELIKKGAIQRPICIFPEGTTSNNQYLLSFKKGAFYTISPIKIFCLKYGSRYFHPQYDLIPEIPHLIMFLSQPVNKFEIIEFDTFNPDYLNLQPEKDWDKYAEIIKSIMLKALNLKDSSSGYIDFNDFEKYIKDWQIQQKLKKRN